MPYPQFDRSRLSLRPLAERVHDMTLDEVMPLDAEVEPLCSADLDRVAEAITQARANGRPVIWMMGAHVIKQGLSRFVVDLLRRGLITQVSMNGACTIHDYELSLIGATTESVANYIRGGEFGLWSETGRVNDFAAQAAAEGIGLGEVIGREILADRPPHLDLSILAAAYEMQVPATVHLGIGYDITHEHPNCDGAALGKASYADFLVFAETVRSLEGGVFLNLGSAVMGPEVYLKALSMARNVARQEGQEIRRFVTANFDLHDLGADCHRQAPKSHPMYYYRPWKTILVRTVADGGESYYIQADHKVSIPELRKRLTGCTG
ncbi:MAG: GSU2086 family protein [Armatimonadota bacterium]